MGQNTALLLKPRAPVPTQCKNSFELKHRMTPIPRTEAQGAQLIVKARSGFLLVTWDLGWRPG